MDIQANGILIDAEGPVTSLKLERVADFINAYKSHGVNTITLTCFIPVDPQSGVIRDQFLTPNRWGKVSVTPEYMAAFTDLALGLGVDVIWKPQFIVDDGRDQNVSDWSLGPAFYPSGSNFSVPVFLNSVKEFWTRWSAVAEQHHVSMLVLGTEQGHFAYPPYSAAWREIIEAARDNFSGKLTYAENHFAPLPGEGRVDFWDALDLIGIDDYSPIGNGTQNTPYDEAYANVFNSSVFTYNTTTRLNVPGVLYNLHLQYDKPVFFTEFAIDSLDGAMNDPAASDFSKSVNYSEQANYFKAKFDVYHNYDWIEGIGIFDIVNEASPSPSSSGWLEFFENGLKKNMEWLNKPAAQVVELYWKESALPPRIHASSATMPTGGFAGTASAPDTLVGGFQNDLFDRLGGTYQIYGAGGFDIASYSGSSANFAITIGEFYTTVVDLTGGEGSGRLFGVEALTFVDRSVSGITGLELTSDPVASVSTATAVKREGGTGTTVLYFTVSLDDVPLSAQTIRWSVQGSAEGFADEADFAGSVLPSGVVTFAVGETTKTITVAVTGDAVVEPDEEFTVTLAHPSPGLAIGTASATGTILNDDASVSLAALSAVKAEGSSGTTSFTFTVTRAGDTSAPHSIAYAVAGSGANPANSADFAGGALPSGVVTFAAGETIKTITVAAAGDTVVEPDEEFAVTLSNPSAGLTIGTASATGGILNDDASVSLAALSAVKAEGSSGTTFFTFTVTLTGDTSVPHGVAWAVTGSGASKADGADFAGGELPTGALTFQPGETSKVLAITVNGDTTVEQDEGFQVSLSNPSSNLKIGTGSASGMIQNDDSLPVTVRAHGDAYIVLEGQSLTIAAATGVLFNDQSASSASLLANAGHGTLQLAGPGGFTYTPAASFTGIDSFTYHAVPGGNGVDGKAVIHVVPVNVGASTTLDLLGLTADEQIAATYTAFFGRAADAGGHDFWVGEFVRGLPTQGAASLFANIASSFGISAEAKALYPFLVNPFGASDSQIGAFLDSVYNNMFNRSSDAVGRAYWTGAIKATLQAGKFVGSVLVDIMSGAQDSVAGKDITTLMGKVAVGLAFVHEQQEHGTVWSGASDIAAATNLLRTVTSDAASVLIGVKNAEVLIANHA